jgi:hypothetical protein
MTVRQQLASLIRTYVPIGVGFVLALLARKYDIVLDDNASAALTSGVAALVSAAYYVVVRVLETRWKAVGWLLGLPVAPQYDVVKGSVVPNRPEPENGVQSPGL